MESESALLKEIRANREASKREHSALLNKFNDIETDLRGDDSRDIEGLIPKVKRHDRFLRPAMVIQDVFSNHPKIAIFLALVALKMMDYMATKGIDKILSLFS